MRPLDAHIVYCEKRMFLDKGPYSDWSEISAMYADYKASNGPFSEDEIVEYFRDDCGQDESRWPFSREAIAAFFRSEERILHKRDVSRPLKPPTRLDRVMTFVLGWTFGILGFVFLMAPVHWLFGRVEASGGSMGLAGSIGLLLIAAGAAFGQRWNRLHRRRT